MRRLLVALVSLAIAWALSGVAFAETSVAPDDYWEGRWGTQHVWTFDPDGHVAEGITAAHEDRGLFALPLSFEPWDNGHPDDYSTITVRAADDSVIHGMVYWLQTAYPLWRPHNNSPALEPGAMLTLELQLTQSDTAKEAGFQDITRNIPITVSPDPAPAAQPAVITSMAFELGAGPNHCGWPAVYVAWNHPADLPNWMGPLVNYKIEVQSPHEDLSDTGGRRDWTGPFEATLPYHATRIDQDLCFVIHTLNRPGGMLNNDGTPTGGDAASAVTEQLCVTAEEVAEAIELAGCTLADYGYEPASPSEDATDDTSDEGSLSDIGPELDGGVDEITGSTSQDASGCAGGAAPTALLWLGLIALACMWRRRAVVQTPDAAIISRV